MRRLIAFILTLGCISASAQFARFRHITVDDGLPQNSISALAQDAKGFIWIGTFEGLSRYDGIRLMPFQQEPDDTSKLYSNAIRCLYPDPDGTLWGGTIGGGMFKLNPVSGKTSKYMFDSSKTNCLSSSNVYAIKEFEPGKLYIATNDGLNIFDKKTGAITVIRKLGKNSIPLLSDNIRWMDKDTRGHIWFAHLNAGVTDYDPKTGKCDYYSANSSDPKKRLSSNNVRTLLADSKGLVWISCWNGGSNVIDTKNGKLYSPFDTTRSFIKDLQKAALVSCFYEDHLHNIWFATAEHGIGKFEAGTYKFGGYLESNKDDPETISDNTVFNIMEDRSGLIWAGTWKGGLNIFDPKALSFGFYKHENNNPASLHNNSVLSFAKKSNDEIYVGTGAAVGIFNTKTHSFSKLPINDKDNSSLRHNSIVTYIFPDTDGSVWFSTQGGYPYRYFPSENKYVNYIATADSTSFSHHTSTVIIKDKKGRLWIATSGGGLNLYNYDKNNFTWILSDKNNETTICSDNISSMALDKSGKIWIGSYDNSLCLFDPDTRTAQRFINRKDGKPLLPDGLVSTLYCDSKNRLWIGTGSGICVLKQGADSVITFGKIHPVFSAIPYGITEDNSGNIWFSTRQGLTRFNPETTAFKVYTTTNGVQGREFSLNAVYRSDDGQLFFGGSNGFNAFYPNELASDSIAPVVSLTGFSVLNKARALPQDITSIKEITLGYKDYFFSFDFAALDFTEPGKNTYEYKLENFNDNWVSIGTEHSVTFTNLDPGEYTLLVRAANGDGTWSKEPASVKLIITPPFWRTKWFYALCIAFVTLIIYLYIKWRERRLQQEKAVLEHKVEERTTELKIEKQKVETAHKDIKDSINYAKKIQEAILPESEEIDKHLQDYFILYKPKDIVAGDFYWFHALNSSELGVRSSELEVRGSELEVRGSELGVRNLENNNTPAPSLTKGKPTQKEGDYSQLLTPNSQLLIAAADCTGHGVPGAFMSMIGSTFLNEIVRKGIYMPDKILNELNVNVRRALKQHAEGSQSRDGMDIALCMVDALKGKLYYAGANRPCIFIQDNQVTEYKADKVPVGGLYTGEENKFTLNEIGINKGSCVYLFSDGYADQFGGPKGKKFMHKNLKDLLLNISTLPMKEQKEKLNAALNEWKGSNEQVDDILVIGLRV